MKTSKHRISRLVLLAFTLLFALAATIGCERKPEDLEQWRTAKGGMEKMKEWAQDSEQPRDVRIRAVEILVEDGQANTLAPTLEGVKDEKLRADMVAAAVPTVEKMWATADYPELTEAAKEEGGVPVGESKAVDAKDAAFFLMSFAADADKEKLQAILAQWMSKDWQLRNQLGSTTLGQVAGRAGDAGGESLLMWLKEAVQPHQVAEIIAQQGDDATKDKAGVILRERAEAEHPDLSPSLVSAILSYDNEALVPYLEKAITDPASPNKLVGAAMDSLVRIRGERAAPFFSDLIKNRSGLIRWVAATRLVEILGKPGFAFVSTGLPVEMDTYPAADEAELKENVVYFCSMYQNEMKEAGVKSVEDQITRGLKSSRWPARVLALHCAQTFQYTDLIDEVSKLKRDRQQVPGWGERTTIGNIATEVAESLSKS